MSHPESVHEDNDADDGRDNGLDLQHISPGISNAATGSASPTSKSLPNEGTTSMFPIPATTTSPYILPLSTSIAILIFPPSLTASTIPSYMPTYRALPDGSLLTPLYTEDLNNSNARLFGGSALLTLFIINVWIAATFLRRAQLSSIKDKSLFYLLLASQVMGPAAFASLLVPFFSRSANCTVYVSHSSRHTSRFNKHSPQRQYYCIHRHWTFLCPSGKLSVLTRGASHCPRPSFRTRRMYRTFPQFLVLTSLREKPQITAILGLKAYRCLNRSRLVLVVLALLQLAIFVLFFLDLPNVRSDRLLSGGSSVRPVRLISDGRRPVQ